MIFRKFQPFTVTPLMRYSPSVLALGYSYLWKVPIIYNPRSGICNYCRSLKDVPIWAFLNFVIVPITVILPAIVAGLGVFEIPLLERCFCLTLGLVAGAALLVDAFLFIHRKRVSHGVRVVKHMFKITSKGI